MFFSYIPEDGFAFHDTADEARARAGDALDRERREAETEGWPEEVTWICWGEIRGQVAELAPDADSLVPGEFVDYALQDTAVGETEKRLIAEKAAAAAIAAAIELDEARDAGGGEEREREREREREKERRNGNV